MFCQGMICRPSIASVRDLEVRGGAQVMWIPFPGRTRTPLREASELAVIGAHAGRVHDDLRAR
jgi:hypothetical protein